MINVLTNFFKHFRHIYVVQKFLINPVMFRVIILIVRQFKYCFFAVE